MGAFRPTFGHRTPSSCLSPQPEHRHDSRFWILCSLAQRLVRRFFVTMIFLPTLDPGAQVPQKPNSSHPHKSAVDPQREQGRLNIHGEVTPPRLADA